MQGNLSVAIMQDKNMRNQRCLEVENAPAPGGRKAR